MSESHPHLQHVAVQFIDPNVPIRACRPEPPYGFDMWGVFESEWNEMIGRDSSGIQHFRVERDFIELPNGMWECSFYGSGTGTVEDVRGISEVLRTPFDGYQLNLYHFADTPAKRALVAVNTFKELAVEAVDLFAAHIPKRNYWDHRPRDQWKRWSELAFRVLNPKCEEKGEFRLMRLPFGIFRASAMTVEAVGAPDWEPPSPRRASNPLGRSLSVDTESNSIVLDGAHYEVEPHEAKILAALVEAKEMGEWWVTGPALTKLPGCRGKKISRVFDALERKVPALRGMIRRGDTRGYRLKS